MPKHPGSKHAKQNATKKMAGKKKSGAFGGKKAPPFKKKASK